MFVRLSAILRRLSRAREWFPPTNLGLVVLALGAGAYWGFGRPRADYVVLLVAALAMALVAAAVLAVITGAILVFRATRSKGSTEVAFEAHRGFAEVFSLPTWWALPVFDVTWTWLQPEGFRVQTLRHDGRRIERVETERRGRFERVVRRFVIEDAFGLARIVLHRTESVAVTVLPWSGALERAPLLRSLAAGDALPHPRGALVGDPVDMRRYVPGDPLKLAMWKVYARTRELMVRTPERAIAPSSQVAAYLVAAEADEPAAAAARVAIETGLLGPDWVFGADGSDGPTSDPSTAKRFIVDGRQHRHLETGQAGGLADFIDQTPQPDTVKLVVFVPGRPGPWLAEVVQRARRRPGNTSCVVVVDGLTTGAGDAHARWSRMLKRPLGPRDEEEAWVTSEEFQEVVRTLAGARIQVTALDRVRGQALSVGRLTRHIDATRQVA